MLTRERHALTFTIRPLAYIEDILHVALEMEQKLELGLWEVQELVCMVEGRVLWLVHAWWVKGYRSMKDIDLAHVALGPAPIYAGAGAWGSPHIYP